eukprot:CAMPEP_0202828592 /NCGR_PEP_ID=MMETSP1389-20130828/15010_1 /ASSEMBLY_ACC=CAM_ASM_000865 /TAXON_ID=302021 /ORGANISM="Rhodomonas sp., Strain CCMP768" /LENGTH=259 /DNA_ID=CAMNT_0049502091 /DNA_START=89 /DNA_END=868 /DNA_ORIENTATION=-
MSWEPSSDSLFLGECVCSSGSLWQAWTSGHRIAFAAAHGDMKPEGLPYTASRLELRGGLSDLFVTRMLFGGGVELRLPSTLEDVSDLRPVPDHQEVWVDSESEASVIVELLEREEEVEDSKIAEHIFSGIATENNATDIEIIAQRRLKDAEVPNLMAHLMCPQRWISCWVLSGSQSVAKFRETTRDTILLHLLVARLPNVDTDLVISLNQPISVDTSVLRSEFARTSVAVGFEQGQTLVEDIARSLRVRNWSLFGGPDM